MKLKIKLDQAVALKKNILKENISENIIKVILRELNGNYEKIDNIKPTANNDYSINHSVKIKLTDEIIEKDDLIASITNKYGINYSFIKQLVSDWFNNSITSDYKLSKNVSLMQ